MNRTSGITALVAAALALATLPGASRADHGHGDMTRPATTDAPAPIEKKAPPPLDPTLGTWHHEIKTNSPQAQKYFDQGLRLVYAFNHDEAIAAFEEASHLDPMCAMAQWGIALAYGPNINLPMDSDRGKAAYAAIGRAKALIQSAAPIEREYINALATRYGASPDSDRKGLDEAYVDAMRQLAKRHPDDDDAQVLFAEALMNLRPWDHWTHDGQPQPGTEEIIATLETVLKRTPNHPGANHYYIHTVEASPDPGRALPEAARLGMLMPGAGHLVHMPAHIYQRTGRYADAANANEKGMKADEKYIAQRKPEGVYPLMYYNHNIHFLWASLTEIGQSKEAIARAREVSGRITPDLVAMMPMVEFIPPTTYYALARFGHWDELLAEKAPPASMRYTSAMWHYGRGMALAAKGQFDAASAERDSVDEIGDALPPDMVAGLNLAVPIVRVAAAVLAGDIAYRQKKYDQAIATYQDAVTKFDALKYDEPPAWYQPPRQLLGKALLDAGRPTDAEAVYREDLKKLPENAWSLMGLSQALAAQGKPQAEDYRKRAAAVFKKADVTLTSSRF